MDRNRASALLVAALVAGSVGVPAAAQAATKGSFDKGTLTITGSPGDDSISLFCPGGVVGLSFGNLKGPAVPCDSVKRLVVLAKDGSDVVQSWTLTAIAFPRLTLVTIDLGPGSDRVALGDLGEKVLGGPGTDQLNFGSSFAPDSAVTLDSSSVVTPAGTDTFSGMESAGLQFQGGTNHLDASEFGGRVSVLMGGSGSDTVIGTDGDDTVKFEAGNDVFFGRAGDDLVVAGTGDDIIHGGTGHDILQEFGITSNVALTNTSMTGVGTDTLSGLEMAILVQSGAVGRTMNFSAFAGFVSWAGGAGVDTVAAPQGGSDLAPSGGADVLTGGPDADRIMLFGITSAVIHNSGANTSQGILTYSSIDKAFVQGTGGSDVINAGAFGGSVSAEGSGGLVDVITTGPGNDNIALYGGEIVSAGDGTDFIDFVTDAPTTLTDSALSGGLSVTLSSVEGATVEMNGGELQASAFSGPITLLGSDLDEVVVGGSGDDVFHMGDGDDSASGKDGKDLLLGESGDDKLNGGPSKDECKGGAGADTLKSCEKGSD